MSFQSFFTGLFNGDTFYPDNPNREKRYQELYSDCSNLFEENKRVAEESKKLMAEFNERLKSLYPKMEKCPETLVIAETVSDKIPYDELSVVFGSLLAIPAVGFAFLITQTVFLAKDGNVEGAIALSLAGTAAMWATGGMACGLLPFLPLVVGSIEGSARRDEFRKKIKELYKSREKLKNPLIVNKVINSHLKIMIDTLKIFSNMNIDEKALEDSLSKEIEKIKSNIENVEELAIKELEEFDRNRGSWMQEDK